MADVTLFFHFFGLMLGAAGGFSTALLMRRALAMPPDQAKVIRSMGPMLAKTTLIGIIILWVTGPMLLSRFGSVSGLGWTFWPFIASAAALAILSIATNVIYAQMAKGNMALAPRLPQIGPLSGIASLLAVLFAVLTFH